MWMAVCAVSTSGVMRFDLAGGDTSIHYQPESGELQPGDTLMMRATPGLDAGRIIGTGLDNAIGVLLALLAAYALGEHAPDAIAGRRLLFAFTDQEEGPPIGLFGQGALRLAHNLEPPRLGFINIDGHNVDEGPGMFWGSARRMPLYRATGAARSCRWMRKRWRSRWLSRSIGRGRARCG